MTRGGPGNRRLDGWKSIALALGKDESTVKRWESTRGLPVHRAGGQRGASVYAWTAEIDHWLSSRRDLSAPAAPPPDGPDGAGRPQGSPAGAGQSPATGPDGEGADGRPPPPVAAEPEPEPRGQGPLADEPPVSRADGAASVPAEEDTASLPAAQAGQDAAIGAETSAADGRSGAAAASRGLRRLPLWALACAAAVVLAALLPLVLPLGAGQRRNPPPAAVHAVSQHVEALRLEAVYLIEKRNVAALERAAGLLEEAVALAPGYAPARTALAKAFNLMVEYGAMPAKEGYVRAVAEASRAVALDPAQAGAHAILGDVAFFRDRAYAEGIGHLRQAVRADPDSAQAHQWLGEALSALGQGDEALVETARARAIEPSSRSVQVSQAIALLGAGRVEAAHRQLETLLRNEPGYSSPLRFLAFADLGLGRHAEYIGRWRSRAERLGREADRRIVLAGEAGLAFGGPQAMAAAMLARARELEPDAEPYFVAHVFALAGDAEGALSRLAAIQTRHAFYFNIDPAFATIRKSPEGRAALLATGLPLHP